MSDEDIKKGYFICRINIEGNCDICPFNKGVNDCSCIDDLNKAIIDLINRQQERIEELEIITGLANNRKYYRKFVNKIFCKQKGNELSEPDFDYIYQLYFEQQAVIDDLKHEIRNLECEKGQLEGTIDFLVAEAKSEAIKEFAERLKMKAYLDNGLNGFLRSMVIDVNDIDNLLAEMVGKQ